MRDGQPVGDAGPEAHGARAPNSTTTVEPMLKRPISRAAADGPRRLLEPMLRRAARDLAAARTC